MEVPYSEKKAIHTWARIYLLFDRIPPLLHLKCYLFSRQDHSPQRLKPTKHPNRPPWCGNLFSRRVIFCCLRQSPRDFERGTTHRAHYRSYVPNSIARCAGNPADIGPRRSFCRAAMQLRNLRLEPRSIYSLSNISHRARHRKRSRQRSCPSPSSSPHNIGSVL